MEIQIEINYREFIFNIHVLSSLLCPQNAYAVNECSLSDSFLDSLAGRTCNSYLAFPIFLSPLPFF